MKAHSKAVTLYGAAIYTILVAAFLAAIVLTGCSSKPARIANRTCNFDPPRRVYVAPPVARPTECTDGECQIPSDVGQSLPATPYLEPECEDGECVVPPSIPLTGPPAQKSEDNEAILEPIEPEGPVGPALEMGPPLAPRGFVEEAQVPVNYEWLGHLVWGALLYTALGTTLRYLHYHRSRRTKPQPPQT